MKRLLIISSFPAPYRVAVFKGLAKYYKMDIFFVTVKDQYRSKDFFTKKSEMLYYILTEDIGKEYFKKCISKIENYDLVLAYDWYLKQALKVELLCIIKKIPYVINCDGAFLEKRKNKIFHPKDFIKKIFICNAAGCFSSGKFATKYYKYYGAEQNKIIEHPFSSLYEKEILDVPMNNGDKIKLKKKLKLSKNKCVVAIGQFIYRKGFDVLLEAWRDFDDEYQLIIIGGGPLGKTYREILKKNSYKNVKLIDFLPKKEIMEYLSLADVFVLPTREDIWGLVINEALSVGTPVITTNKCVAGMELIKNGQNGFIVNVDDSIELSKKMFKILRLNDCEIKKMRQQALYSIKNYTIESIVRSHHTYIDTILTKD